MRARTTTGRGGFPPPVFMGVFSGVSGVDLIVLGDSYLFFQMLGK